MVPTGVVWWFEVLEGEGPPRWPETPQTGDGSPHRGHPLRYRSTSPAASPPERGELKNQTFMKAEHSGSLIGKVVVAQRS